MFERFTDEARAVVRSAQEEARGLHHHYVGTEHLLLGLLGSTGVASRALEGFSIRLDDVRSDVGEPSDGLSAIEPVHDDAAALRTIGIDLDEVRDRVEEAFGAGALDRAGRRSRGRERGRVTARRSSPFTRRARKVLELSLREALRLGHHHIGTEHILLGLVRESEGVAMEVLVSRGATAERVREAVMAELSARGELPGRSA